MTSRINLLSLIMIALIFLMTSGAIWWHRDMLIGRTSGTADSPGRSDQ